MPPSSPETVLVTGASSGIGRELAHCFARDGATCVLLARREAALRDVAATLQTTYDTEAHVLPADLSVPDAAEDIAATLDERGLAVDVLANNAGFGARGAVVALEVRCQVGMIQVNVTALTRFTPRSMLQQRG